MAANNVSSVRLPGKLYDFKSPKIATFELENGRSHYCAFTLNKKQFGTVRQCQLMHQLLYAILFNIGVRNSDVLTSKHDPLTPSELLELPLVDGVSSQAWLYMKGRWRLKILEHRKEKLFLKLKEQEGEGEKEEEEDRPNAGQLYTGPRAGATPMDTNQKRGSKIVSIADENGDFLHHLWTQIVELSKPMCSTADIALVDEKRRQAAKASSKRKAYNNAMGIVSNSNHQKKSDHPNDKKRRKIYRPRGVTVITGNFLNKIIFFGKLDNKRINLFFEKQYFFEQMIAFFFFEQRRIWTW
jgi:hypothetical protein